MGTYTTRNEDKTNRLNRYESLSKSKPELMSGREWSPWRSAWKGLISWKCMLHWNIQSHMRGIPQPVDQSKGPWQWRPRSSMQGLNRPVHQRNIGTRRHYDLNRPVHQRQIGTKRHFGHDRPVHQRQIGTKRHFKLDQVNQKYLIRGRSNDGKTILKWASMVPYDPRLLLHAQIWTTGFNGRIQCIPFPSTTFIYCYFLYILIFPYEVFIF